MGRVYASEIKSDSPKASPSSTRSVVADTGYGFLRGLSQVPGDVMSAVGSAIPFGGGGGMGRPNPGLLSPDRMQMAAEAQSQAMNNAAMQATGTTAPPVSFGGRVGERVGRSAPYTAGAAPYLSAMGGARAVGLGVIGDVVSSISQQFAEDAGAGPLGQTMAGFAGIFVPSGIADDAVAAAKGAGRFAREAAEQAPLNLTPAQTKQVAELATEFGVHSDEIIDSMKTWQSIFPAGPKGAARQHIEEAVSKLRSAQKIWPDPEVRPTVSQILFEEGGANLAHLNAGLMAETNANARAAGLRIRVARDLEERWASMVPNSSGPNINEAARTAFGKLKQAEREAWDAIPAAEMPHIKIEPLSKAAEAVQDIEAYRNLIKPEVDTINRLAARFQGKAPFNQVQALRSNLTEIVRNADNPLADSDAKNKARAARMLLEPIEKYIDGLPESGSSAYMAAREATKRVHGVFPRKSRAIRSAMDWEDGKAIVRSIKGSPNSATEARRVVNAIQDEPGAVESFRSAVWDDLFDGDPSKANPRVVRGKIRSKRAFYRVAFGDQIDPKTGKDPLTVIDELLTAQDIARRDVVGTAAEARVTRSGLRPVQKLLAGARAITNPGEAVGKGFQVVSDEIDKAAKDNFWRQAIFTELLFDTDSAIKFMEIPTPREVEPWKENFRVLVARAQARNKARALLEGRAGLRAYAQEGEQALQSGQSPDQSGGVR